ncbi:FG-GAP repeat domain-containing protein [Allostreptomyces psammosilenae]|uniref:Uncharacterized protein n=1 Tax=Allostreptomyces psammosilenae TaxID=1892865 RepID=A0A853ABU0_9ACTN|nr:VCBS repeat-containing protein [Allostreptomyces psammosilenae]NYI07948.1 hypothetical protein [Allostreptomyces psammosilenae]
MSSGTRPPARSARRAARLLATCSALVASAVLSTAVPAPPAVAAPAASTAAAVAPRNDFNGDGRSDLVLFRPVRPYSGSRMPEVLASLPSGEMYLWGLDVLGESAPPDWKDLIAPGDVTGDGSSDLLGLTATGSLRLFDTRAENDFLSSYWRGIGWQMFNKVLGPGDVTGDGLADLLARTPGGDLYLYVATGDRTNPFAPRVRVGGGWQGYDQLVGLGDINRDGLGDVAARTPAGDLYLYHGTGSATAPLALRRLHGPGWGGYTQLIGVGDYTGDGVADLLARTTNQYRDPVLHLHRGNGSGGFLARTSGPDAGWHIGFSYAGAGGNGYHGRTDYYHRTSTGQLYHHRVFDGAFVSPRLVDTPTGGTLVYANALTEHSPGDLLRRDTSGVLYNGSTRIGPGWNMFNAIVGPGDLTGDGKGDLVARTPAGELYLYAGNGSGAGFATRRLIGPGWQAYNRLLGGGDITGDGRADLLARTPAGDLYLYRGTGSASAPFQTRVRLGGGWSAFRDLVSPGDINGDGYADLLASDNELMRVYFADRRGSLWRDSTTSSSPDVGLY